MSLICVSGSALVLGLCDSYMLYISECCSVNFVVSGSRVFMRKVMFVQYESGSLPLIYNIFWSVIWHIKNFF